MYARRCTDKDTNLEANSIDVAFICDVYHHMEYRKHNQSREPDLTTLDSRPLAATVALIDATAAT